MKQPDAQTTTPTPHWVWNSDTFASLMLGRVQLAQISRGATTWSWTLFFCRSDERSFYGAKDKAVAMETAEAHARKVLADA